MLTETALTPSGVRRLQAAPELWALGQQLAGGRLVVPEVFR